MKNLTLKTPLIELHAYKVAKLSGAAARKLAISVAAFAGRSDAASATVNDLLNYYPMRYEDRSHFLGIDKLYDGLEASVELYTRVSGGFQVGKNRNPRQPKLYIFEISASDADRAMKPVVVWWFVSGKQSERIINYYREMFSRGTRFVAFGKWEWDGRRNTFALKLAKPDELEILPGSTNGLLADEPVEPNDDELLEDTNDPEFETVHTNRIVPVYRKLGPFQTKRLREIIFGVIENLDRTSVKEHLPKEIRERRDLIGRSEAICSVHFPPAGSSAADYEMFRSPAQRRLIFDELFWVSFALQLRGNQRKKEPKGTVIEITNGLRKRAGELTSFELTNAQTKAIDRIFTDLASDSPMNRLLQGDVGSGKTIVAFTAMFAAIENGYQAALMAPTEILAEQHFRNAHAIFSELGYRTELLTGSLKAAEKRRVHGAISSVEADIIIGTHAVIQDAVNFEKLGLAVIDEQHRFGVLQRAEFRERGYNPDILVMTATPIPRSLAMAVYGDLDVSIIDELPPGRTPIKTVVVGDDQREGVYKGIVREIKLGRQVYVVYPLIEESEKLDLKAATKMFEELRDKAFPQYSVGLLHGKMKQPEKEETMAKFVGGEIDILVSTTVIEVGVDVPNASVMLIEHAERFGLSQLHQLRGRVGRGAEQSFCILLTGDKKTAVAKERLGIMEETNDGFKIAEKDLEIRGQGEIFGTRQSGVQTFRIANIIRDLEILEDARNDAVELLSSKRMSAETSELIAYVKRDPRFDLAGIG